MEHLSVTVALYVCSAVITACTTALGVFISRVLRVLNIFRDFPPHAHINGTIFYPDGFNPPEIEQLVTGVPSKKANGAD